MLLSFDTAEEIGREMAVVISGFVQLTSALVDGLAQSSTAHPKRSSPNTGPKSNPTSKCMRAAADFSVPTQRHAGRAWPLFVACHRTGIAGAPSKCSDQSTASRLPQPARPPPPGPPRLRRAPARPVAVRVAPSAAPLSVRGSSRRFGAVAPLSHEKKVGSIGLEPMTCWW
jgi:hypothetical protein